MERKAQNVLLFVGLFHITKTFEQLIQMFFFIHVNEFICILFPILMFFSVMGLQYAVIGGEHLHYSF